MKRKITLPLTREKAAQLRSGDSLLLSGVIYTARDAAHKRMVEMLSRGEELPLPISDAVIYYVGPTPARPGRAIGSAGPTTSYRMDAYTPTLLNLGLRGMIGKGERSPEVINSMEKAGAVYMGAVGGAGALLATRIVSCEVVAFPDLGAEAVHRLEVDEFPVRVIMDCHGGNLYQSGRAAYLESLG